MRKNTWMFNIKSLQGQQHLNRLCFYGVDSEEAHTNCIEWAEKQYNMDCIAILVEGEIERNEARRAKVLEDGPEEVKQFVNILKIRKVKTIQ